MKIKTSQAGITPFIVIFLICIVAVVALAGLRVYQVNKDTNHSLDRAASDELVAAKSEEKTYANPELGINLKYPVYWGEPNYSDNTLLFSKQPALGVGFVTQPFNDYTDGCLEPVAMEKRVLEVQKANTIGWQGNKLKKLTYDYSNPEFRASIRLMDLAPSYTRISAKDNVLVYKDTDDHIWQAGPDSCGGTITPEQATEANAYNKYVHYALNFTNNKIIGVNAQYDGRKFFSPLVNNQIIDTLNSVKQSN